jgi:hypothetical protein
MEMLVRLTTPEALHGVLSVLHQRRAEVRHLRYDGTTLRVGVVGEVAQLVQQVARRVDVLAVELVASRKSTTPGGCGFAEEGAQVRCTEPSSATRQPGLWATSHG